MYSGIIYKYTNLINNKIYIGQTRQSLEKRHSHHLNDGLRNSNNSYFDKALAKYGPENFKLEIIEDNIPLEKLDDMEMYYIRYYDSFILSGKGYNMNKGGKAYNSNQLVTGNNEKEIKDLLLHSNLTFKEIANNVNVPIGCVYDINKGKTFTEIDLTYPLRTTVKPKVVLTEELLSKVVDMLQHRTDLTIAQIAKECNITEYNVGSINQGRYKKLPKNLEYPIRSGIKKWTNSNILNFEDVDNICYDIIFTDIKFADIGKKYGVATGTIGDISRGLSWKEITSNYKTPISKNKVVNKEIYNSLHGIV